MKLINEDLNNEIVFEENKVNLLVIENKKKFVELFKKLLNRLMETKENFLYLI